MDRSPQRAAAFRKAVERAGVQVEAQLWTLGPYDGVLILNAEDERKALRALSQLVKAGFVRTETLPAFDADEVAKVIRG
jgi:uncharacterized protein with GYD domain